MVRPKLPSFARFRRSWPGRLESHFRFEVDGSSISYCYIRKNGCSAFKRLMLDLAEYEGPWDRAIDVMNSNFRVRSMEEVENSDWRIFVYRDPIDRVVSLFRHKLIMQDGAADILHEVAAVSGREPEGMTFTDFVSEYLWQRPHDPHTRSQSRHLLPVYYNGACSLQTLLPTVTEALGSRLAERYFAKPANLSSGRLFDDDARGLSVKYFRDRFSRSGELPSMKAILSDDAQAIIRSIYLADYGLCPPATIQP